MRRAASFWKQWKSPLLAICKAHKAEAKAFAKANLAEEQS